MEQEIYNLPSAFEDSQKPLLKANQTLKLLRYPPVWIFCFISKCALLASCFAVSAFFFIDYQIVVVIVCFLFVAGVVARSRLSVDEDVLGPLCSRVSFYANQQDPIQTNMSTKEDA